MIPQTLLHLFFFFFDRQTHRKKYIRKGHLEADPKAYRVYKRRQKAQIKEEGIQKITSPQLAPSQ